LTELVPQLENETEQQRAESLERCLKGLKAAVKADKLGGYFEGTGQNARWMLPVPKN
jgi:hypothetical protein